MQTKPPLKHVIFLGAGASRTSGYPLANELRLRLADDKTIQADLKLRYADCPAPFQIVSQCLEDFKESIELFRHGAFGSVDEFAKLSSVKYSKHVRVMKRLTRLGLSLHNPEDNFHESDYYPFIQSLFDDKELHLLKRHITVLSYNYDCYLDYLLLRAQSQRNRLADTPEPDVALKNRLSSGFFKMDDPHSLVSLSELHNQHFRHYKLHGSMTYADPHLHKQLFELGIEERLKPFGRQECKESTTPIVFPWELFGEDGGFIRPPQFVFKKDATNDVKHDEANKLYNLYNAIWRGAREAVQQAEKISFVGMSVHQYLTQGLRFLFDGRERGAEVVVANTANKDFKDSQIRLHPASPCGRVAETLKSIAPKMKFARSSAEAEGIFRWSDGFNADDSAKEADYDITPRYSFGEFIEREME